jgi:hypothetical protein
MDHQILKALLRKTVRCRGALWLLERIIDGSNPQEPVCVAFAGDDLAEASQRRVGLPIGNLTSQWFGGIYLNEFDHWVKEELRCRGYVRYVDDFLLFADNKEELRRWRAAIAERLTRYRLRLNERKSRVHRTVEGITFLGQRVWPWKRRLCRANLAAARRRLLWNVRQYRRGDLSQAALLTRWNSWRGHALQAQAGPLIDQVRSQLRYALGPAGN